tara:strand:+ start:25 stop:1788 length:1764 start_codon:yes stop_codon:yes gene_type:complete
MAYIKPIPLEELPYTPVELGEMLDNDEKEKEIEIEGYGKGRLVISPQNQNKPFFYADEANLPANQKAAKQLQVAETAFNAPLLLSPLLGLASGIPKIAKDKTRAQIKQARMYADESNLEGAINLSQIVNGVFQMPSQKYQRVRNVLKKNPGISYKDAMEYVNLVEKGTPPTKPIKPGNITGVTNKGLLKSTDKDDPTVYIPPEERPDNTFFSMNVDREDVPTFDLSTMIDPIRGKNRPDVNILNVLNTNGMRGGRVDVFKYRAAGKNRQAVEYYLSPYSKMVKFNLRKNNVAASMDRKFGDYKGQLGLAPKGSFQAHHVVPIKAAFLGFHGIVKESPKYNYYMKLYHDELLKTGNQVENIVEALGHVDREKDSPHSLVHQFIEQIMGKSGEKFWTDEIIETLVVRDETGDIIGTRNDEMRERLMRKQIELFKRGEGILNIAMKEYTMYASSEIIPPEVIVDYFTDKLPVDLKFTPQLIKKIVNDAMQDMTGTYVPSVVGGTVSRDTMDILRDIQGRPSNWWSQLTTAEKKAKLPELTESYRGAGDGYSFERISELIDAGQLSDSMMQKLLSAEKPDFEGFINELFRD